jgi:23S rRNA pseudouridine2605 synthase
MALIRLQKILARAGLGSRRTVEEFIRDGRVAVNGVRAVLGMGADANVDEITVDGKRVEVGDEFVLLMIHKPPGLVTTRSDERGRKTIYSLLPKEFHSLWYIGRLDADSEGLLLMTNDGGLTERLTHPRYGVEKEYVVTPTSRPTAAQLASLQRGASVSGRRRVKPARIKMDQGDIHIVVREGAKHEVRSLCASAGIPIERLVRIRMGAYVLPDDLPSGAWRRIG